MIYKDETMHDVPEYKKKEKTISLIYFSTLFAALKEGFTTEFVLPFAIALNATSEYLAMIATAPQLMGSLFQLFASDLLNVIKKRKHILIITSLLDAFLWLPILLIPFVWHGNYVLLLNFLVLKELAMNLLNPFYNSFLGDVIPQERRGAVLGRVNQLTGIFSFVATMLSGAILAIYKPVNVFHGFAIVFFLAFISRTISGLVKIKYYDPEPSNKEQKHESLIHFGKHIKETNFGKFVLYASSIKFALGISGPFFSLYMLSYLKMNFMTYTLINSASIISSFVILNKFGKDIDKNGSKKLLELTGILIPFVPILWIYFKSPIILFIVQLAGGAAWAGYNLSTSNFVLDATNTESRLAMTSYYNFFNGVMTFLGAILGGLIMKNLPMDFMGNIFYFIFALSGILRLISSVIFLPRIREERFIDISIKGPKAKRIVSFAPRQGVVYEFVPRKK